MPVSGLIRIACHEPKRKENIMSDETNNEPSVPEANASSEPPDSEPMPVSSR
jgi:hypothetical protein